MNHKINNAKKGVLDKIDLYINQFIKPKFNPNDIFWWFSVSGGKDSFTMSRSIWEWYQINNYKFSGKGFYINQWNRSNYKYLKEQFYWMDIVELEANKVTANIINYQEGQQAPCRICADIRRHVNDDYVLNNFVPGKINLIARGIHLSDISISLLWRSLFNSDPFTNYKSQNKGLPLVKLFSDVYLAKPMMFVREFESLTYSAKSNYKPCCCGCPGCKYPSRRDIVEETVLKFFEDNPLWEFTIPSVRKFLNQWGEGFSDIVEAQSLSGIVNKSNRIPNDFYDFAYKLFINRVDFSLINHVDFNKTLSLDTIGSQWLSGKVKSKYDQVKIPIPKFLDKKNNLIENEKRMISTLGPFWGAIGCETNMQNRIWELQQSLFNFRIDLNWSQSNTILNEYYKSKEYVIKNSKTNCFLCLHSNCNNICNH